MKKQITHFVAIAVLGLVTFFAIPNRVQRTGVQRAVHVDQ